MLLVVRSSNTETLLIRFLKYKFSGIATWERLGQSVISACFIACFFAVTALGQAELPLNGREPQSAENANTTSSSNVVASENRIYELKLQASRLFEPDEKRYESALSLLLDAIALSSSRSQLFAFREQKCSHSIDYKSATEELNKLIDETSQDNTLKSVDAMYMAMRATIYYFSGNNKAALLNANGALLLHPNLSYGFLVRALVNERLGKVDHAFADVDSLYKGLNEHAIAALIRSKLFEDSGDKSTAITVLDQFLAHAKELKWKSDNPNITKTELKLKQLTTDSPNARQEIAKLVRANQCTALCLVDSEKNRVGHAIELINAAIALSPSASELYRFRASYFLMKGALIEALSDINRAIALDPHEPFEYEQRANIVFHLHQYQAALDDINQALAGMPSYRQARLYRAKVYSKLGRETDAMAELDALAKDNPLSFDSYKVRIDILLESKRHDDAKKPQRIS